MGPSAARVEAVRVARVRRVRSFMGMTNDE
jgi:hypothetical protein